MSNFISTEADQAVLECLDNAQSFALIAGAGSGKTTSLIEALTYIGNQKGSKLRQDGQRVACITYTKRAVEVIKSRLKFDDLYMVTTLHSFLWGEISRFQKDIREALEQSRIPHLLEKSREKDTGRNSKEAIKARLKVEHFEQALAGLGNVQKFRYDNSAFNDYLSGNLSHDDIIEISGYLLIERPLFRKLLGLRFPYIFVDEAQDTFESIMAGLNLTCSQENLPLVGYFGDPWQQIYDGRATIFTPPDGGKLITKKENFRSSKSVISLLNSFRKDVEQFPAGENVNLEGSVEIRLAQAEEPAGERKRYTEPQLLQALEIMDQSLEAWGWKNREDVTSLFLVRQMIARRLGFAELNSLFTGQFASARAQEDYESGEHYLLKPFIKIVWPIISSNQDEGSRSIIDIFRNYSPAFNLKGANSEKSLKTMIELSRQHLINLYKVWSDGTTKDVLIYCHENNLISISERFSENLKREPRKEDFDEEKFGAEKNDWLVDTFFKMQASDLKPFCEFMINNTNYSTQHGVKGEEYPNVVVVYDDIEASWNNYNFIKLLTPQTAGEPTDGQYERGRKLAYVSFSRAKENLRILLFTPDPEKTKSELLSRKLFNEQQIVITNRISD